MQGFIASVFDFVSVKSCEHHDDSQGLHSYSSIRPFLHSSHPVLLLGSFHSLAAKQEYRGVFKKQNYTNTYLMQSLHGKSHPRSWFLFFTFASLPWLEQRRMRRLCRASVSLSDIAVATPKKFFPRDSHKSSLVKTTQAISLARRQLDWQRALCIFREFYTRETRGAKPRIEMPLINTTITAARNETVQNFPDVSSFVFTFLHQLPESFACYICTFLKVSRVPDWGCCAGVTWQGCLL